MKNNKKVDPLSMNPNNPLFQQFLKKNNDVTEENCKEYEYRWKTFLLKKYFKDRLCLGVFKVIAGAVFSPLAFYFNSIFRLRISPELYSIIFVATILICFFFCIGFGTLEIIIYLFFLKNSLDYIWEKQNNVSEQIKKFYG